MMWDTSIKNCSQCRLRRSELCVCFESRSVRTSEMQWNICWLGRRKAGSSKSWDVLEGACFKRRRTMANISLHKLPTPWITLPTPTSPSLYIYSTYIFHCLLPPTFAIVQGFVCPYTMQVNSAPTLGQQLLLPRPLFRPCGRPPFCVAVPSTTCWRCFLSISSGPPPPTPLFLPQHLSCIVCGKNRTKKKKE